jgi:hypothetical protein
MSTIALPQDSFSPLSAGGVFTTEIFRHRLMSRALESGDPEKVTWTAKYLNKLRAFFGPQFDLISLEQNHNLIPNEGLDDLLDVWCAGGSQVSNRYVALFESNSTPASTWTSANFSGTNCTEWTSYDEAARQLWQKGSVSSQSISNSANKAVFTANATKTLYGAALLSASAKGGSGDGSGILYAATRYGTPRSVVATDVVNVQYTLTAASA